MSVRSASATATAATTAAIGTAAAPESREVKRFTRIVRTDDGGSAFEDGELRLEPQQIARGFAPTLTGGLPSSGAGVLYLFSPAEFDSEPHPAPRRQWVVLLRGMLDVVVSNGERRRFAPGDLVFVADTTGQGHTSYSAGDPPFELLFIPSE
jgi:hypothetical protein